MKKTFYNWASNKVGKAVSIICCAILIFAVSLGSAQAYFDRGPLALELGQSAVTVSKGKTVTVSVKVTPSSSKQLPGCGMPECPQSCGEKNCLNADGECTCNGTEYKTYKSDVKTSTADGGIATASYKGGVLTIKGVAAGETTITVTGMLRQFREDTKTIKVTVGGESTEQKSGVAAVAEKPSSSKADGNKVEVKPVDKPQETAKDAKDDNDAKNDREDREDKDDQAIVAVVDAAPEAASEELPTDDKGNLVVSGANAVMSERGPIFFVPIKEAAKMGKIQMEQVLGQEATVTFEKRDSADNILYSWSFEGKQLKTPADLDLTIRTSNQGTAELQNAAQNKAALFLDFAHQGELPGAAIIYLRVNGVYGNGAALNLYYYNEETKQVELIGEKLVVENGCVSFPLSHCSQYILTEADLAGGSSSLVYIFLAVAVAAVLCLAGFLFWRQRQRKQA